MFVNVKSLPKSFSIEKKYREEIQLIAQYIQTHTFKDNTVILMPEPWIGRYYNKNSHLTIVYAPTGCKSMHCLSEDSSTKSADEILLILDSHSIRMLDTEYFRNFPHATFFSYFSQTMASSMFPIFSSKLNESWIRVYTLTPNNKPGIRENYNHRQSTE
jgi:hypothetical protein